MLATFRGLRSDEYARIFSIGLAILLRAFRSFGTSSTSPRKEGLHI